MLHHSAQNVLIGPKSRAHALLSCKLKGGLNDWISSISRRVVPRIRVKDILTLNLGISNLDKAFPLVWFLSVLLETVWKSKFFAKCSFKDKS